MERGHLWVLDFILPFSGNQFAFEIGNPVFKVRGCDFEMQPHARSWEVIELVLRISPAFQ